ncbi:MAG: response regulator [Elusimicrobia bacterium]|nr:response regulator [Elusimicrobiota bacterium]
MGWFSRKKRILIADDEEPIRLMVKDALGEKYDVKGVANGSLCLDAVNDSKPDLVILDVMMPEMDGWSVLDVLKRDEKTRDIPVLMLTSLQRGVDVEASFTRGAKDYLPKPFSLALLLKKVQRLAPTE